MGWPLIYIILRIADVATTMILYYGPGAVEVNPIQEFLLRSGCTYFAFGQTFGTVLVAFAMVRLLSHRWGVYAVRAITLVQAIVVLSNMLALVGFYYYAYAY